MVLLFCYMSYSVLLEVSLLESLFWLLPILVQSFCLKSATHVMQSHHQIKLLQDRSNSFAAVTALHLRLSWIFKLPKVLPVLGRLEVTVGHLIPITAKPLMHGRHGSHVRRGQSHLCLCSQVLLARELLDLPDRGSTSPDPTSSQDEHAFPVDTQTHIHSRQIRMHMHIYTYINVYI